MEEHEEGRLRERQDAPVRAEPCHGDQDIRHRGVPERRGCLLLDARQQVDILHRRMAGTLDGVLHESQGRGQGCHDGRLRLRERHLPSAGQADTNQQAQHLRPRRPLCAHFRKEEGSGYPPADFREQGNNRRANLRRGAREDGGHHRRQAGTLLGNLPSALRPHAQVPHPALLRGGTAKPGQPVLELQVELPDNGCTRLHRHSPQQARAARLRHGVAGTD